MYAYPLPVLWSFMSPSRSKTFDDSDNQSDAHARISRDGTGLNLNWKAMGGMLAFALAVGWYGSAEVHSINTLAATSEAHTATLAQMGKQFQRMDFKLNALLTKNGLDPMTVNRQATAMLDDTPAGK